MYAATTLLAIAILCSRCLSENKTVINFSYITTITGGIRAIGGKPVIDLALEEVNNRTDVLQNYTLNYTTVLNSECNRTAALDRFIEEFGESEDPNRTIHLALLCCGCSPATIPVAEISHYWNIPQIAFAAAANELTNRYMYKSFFRPLPSFEFIGASLAELVRQFQWRQMAIVSQDETLFTGVNRVLRTIFKSENWTLDESSLITSNEEYFTTPGLFPFEKAFEWMKNGDFRVIHINGYAEYAYMTLCRAHELGLLPPRYVWITPMWYNKEWWKPISEKLSDFSCSESDILEVIIGSIGVVPEGYFLTENETVSTFSGLTPDKFNKEYQRRLALPQYSGLEELGIAGVAYDTIWSLALGLDNAFKRIVEKNDTGCEGLAGSIVPLEKFTYTNRKMGCILHQGLSEVHFTGITGPIMFNAVGSRADNTLLVQQYRKTSNGIMERETAAQITIRNLSNTFLYRVGESETSLWESGAPYDGSPEEVIHDNNIILVGFYYVFAFLGLICAVVCLIFNIFFRNKKVVKLSSPNLNYLIIVGATLLYLCVYLSVTSVSSESAATILCNFRFWIFSLGYTMCFAVILSKSWRIYHIFNNPKLKKKAIKDWYLLVIIFCIVAIDVFVLFIGTAVPSLRLHAVKTQDSEQFKHVTDDGMNEEFYVYVCATDQSFIWLGISFGYKGFLQIVAMFMAFHTRRVKIRALNDSKETAAIIYINSVVIVMLAVSVFVLEGYHNVHATLFGLALLIQATLFIGILFIPKAISLYKDPEGLKIFTFSQQNGVSNMDAAMSPFDTSTAASRDPNKKLKEGVIVKESEAFSRTEEAPHIVIDCQTQSNTTNTS